MSEPLRNGALNTYSSIISEILIQASNFVLLSINVMLTLLLPVMLYQIFLVTAKAANTVTLVK